MLRENNTIVVAKNERWEGASATEPVECGWASEAIFFVRALADPVDVEIPVIVEISPDGMRWLAEGTRAFLPRAEDEMPALRVRHFGNWLRLRADLPAGVATTLLISLHLK